MLAPKLVVVTGVGEFGADIDGVAVGGYTTADERGDAQFGADLLGIHVLALVAENGIARFHFEVGNVGEAADERFSKAIAKVVFAGVAADVGEGQHGNGIDGGGAGWVEVPGSRGKQSDGCKGSDDGEDGPKFSRRRGAIRL